MEILAFQQQPYLKRERERKWKKEEEKKLQIWMSSWQQRHLYLEARKIAIIIKQPQRKYSSTEKHNNVIFSFI